MTTKSRAEMETIITRAADESEWHVFSEDPPVVRKLQRLYGDGKPRGGGYVWRVAKALLSFRSRSSDRVAANRRPPSAASLAALRAIAASRRAKKQADAQAPAEVIK